MTLTRSAADLSEPAVRGSSALGFRAAAVALWGAETLKVVAPGLSPEVRRARVDEIILPFAWMPERCLAEWRDAVWEGPAAHESAPFLRAPR